MEVFVALCKAFVIGGIICALCQILLEKTKLTAPKLLVGLVVTGVILGAIGVYQPFTEFAGAGATVPLLGFGATLARGVQQAIANDGLFGIFTGGLTASAGGIAAAVVFAYIAALLFNPKTKP